ncbi:MAG: hypothetical protein JWO91_17 [Acidobacteriaceae bacterium]|nr:hypothetical protein [Acidobacteriaceae bacterium]
MYRVSKMVRTTLGQDGAVVLDIQRGRVLRLNVTGSFIFERLQRGDTESQIIDAIMQHFCVSHDVAQVDVGEFLKSLKQAGIIHNGN